MTDPTAELLKAMAEDGLHPKGIIWDSSFHRFPGVEQKKGDNGWYKAYVHQRGAVYGDHRTKLKRNWTMRGLKPLTDEERADNQRRQKDAANQRRKDAIAAQKRVDAIWARAKPCENHPYLERMGIAEPGNVRVVGDMLLIPIRSLGEEGIVNLECIDPDGRVEYMRGVETKLSYVLHGRISTEAPAITVYVCERWADGWTIHDATQSLVVTVFFRSQLSCVARALSRMFSGDRLIIAAVNERWVYTHHDGRVLPNPGVLAAREAADSVSGGLVAIPDFSDLHGRPTSFNDLRLREGRKAVLRALDPREAERARVRLEGHDVLETVCRARFPDPDTHDQRLRVGEALCRVLNGFADMNESGARGSLRASSLLRSAGLMVVGDGLLISNQGGWLHTRLDDRWPARRWKSLLRELPDTRPTPPKYFVDGLTSRATSVPLSLLKGGL